jgi:hypothetical protein
MLTLNNPKGQKRGLPTVEEEDHMPLFKRDLLRKVLEGQKTQTRRTHKRTLKVGREYGIRSTRFEKSQCHIKITRCFQQKLGDVTDEEAKKEGFKDLEEFRQRWTKIYGSWDPNQVVMAYEFRPVGDAKKGKPSPAKASRQP